MHLLSPSSIMSRKTEKIQQEMCPALPLSTFSVFLFLSKTVRFPDKENWDFALSFLALLSPRLPGHSFIRTEAFVHSIWGWTEGKYYYSLMFWIDTSQASLCTPLAGLHVKLFLFSKGPSSAQSLSPLALQGRTANSAVKRRILSSSHCLPRQDLVVQLKSRYFVWGRWMLRLSVAFSVRREKATVRSGLCL